MELKSRAELWKLFDLGDVAEIGVAQGLFSRDILAWGVKKLYLVDNWNPIQSQTGDGAFDERWHQKNLDNVKKINDRRVTILRGISWDMASHVPDDSLSLLYIDCCHSFECVKRDLEAWFPKVKQGGLIAGHDYDNPDYGVKDAVHQFCSGRFTVTRIPQNGIDSSFYFFKNAN